MSDITDNYILPDSDSGGGSQSQFSDSENSGLSSDSSALENVSFDTGGISDTGSSDSGVEIPVSDAPVSDVEISLQDEIPSGEENSPDNIETPGENQQTASFDSEILTDINLNLYQHKFNFEEFTADVVTVSGNSITVTPDDATSLLLQNISDNQIQSIENQTFCNNLLFCFFLAFMVDIMLRFAKRIVKNMTGGDKND